MSEQKTYKNVGISDDGAGITLYPRDSWSAPLDTFMHKEWDVEVTFTRKPRPVEVGDRVRMIPEGLVGVGTVLAFHEKWAWVRWDGSVYPAMPHKAYLKHAEDDNDD